MRPLASVSRLFAGPVAFRLVGPSSREVSSRWVSRTSNRGKSMLDLAELHQHVQTLDKGDDTARRGALHALVAHGEQEWATAPAAAAHSLVTSLQRQLLDRTKHAFHLQ